MFELGFRSLACGFVAVESGVETVDTCSVSLEPLVFSLERLTAPARYVAWFRRAAVLELPLAYICDPIALVRGPVTFVGDPVAFVGRPVSFVRATLSLIKLTSQLLEAGSVCRYRVGLSVTFGHCLTVGLSSQALGSNPGRFTRGRGYSSASCAGRSGW